jgi:DNA-binding GntR family transcriptional regulator
MNHSLKHGSLRTDVYNTIRDNIIDQTYPAGKSLTECSLTEALGVSRTPVREALAQLETDGLVDYLPNKGVVVRGLSIQDIKDMYDIRICIEGIAVKRACENLSVKEIGILHDILKREEGCVQKLDYEGFQSLDNDFHDVLIRASGSRIFQTALSTALKNTRIARVRSISTGKRIKYTIEEHFDIYSAIVKHDPEQSRKMMERHIRNAKESFIDTMIQKGLAI